MVWTMEREDSQKKYLIEADQFNDCLIGLEANTARYNLILLSTARAPSPVSRFDVVWPGWPLKSCESEDSGMGRENVCYSGGAGDRGDLGDHL